MRLATVVQRNGVQANWEHTPEGAHAVWVEPDGTMVHALTAYRQVARLGLCNTDTPEAALYSVAAMLERFDQAGNWAWLEQIRAAWLHGRAGREDLQEAVVRPSDVTVTLPFTPPTFRDFYAFEEHVRTCRGRRGLEMVPEWYEFPVFYFSNPRSFRGPGVPVHAPLHCGELDFELEVACVVGKRVHSVNLGDADEAIAGYVILNDWSARDIQRSEVKVGLGPAKGKDFATSFGPYLVTPSELEAYAVHSPAGRRHNLAMTARVNGQVVSRGNLKDLHFTFAEMLVRASQDVTLMPGDVLGSGTVGSGCILELGTDVQPWLVPGDVVELEVAGLGTLSTPIEMNPGKM